MSPTIHIRNYYYCKCVPHMAVHTVYTHCSHQAPRTQLWPFTWARVKVVHRNWMVRHKADLLYTCMYVCMYVHMYICIYTYCNHDSAWVGLHCYNIIMQYEHKIHTHMLHTWSVLSIHEKWRNWYNVWALAFPITSASSCTEVRNKAWAHCWAKGIDTVSLRPLYYIQKWSAGE